MPPIFRWLGESGRVPEYDLRRAFNMGIGMILVVAPQRRRMTVRQDLLERRRGQQRRDRRDHRTVNGRPVRVDCA